MAVKYADMVYNGLWYSPVRDAMDAFVAKTQERVTGVVRVRLFKGSAHVVGRKSPNALYDRGLATYVGADDFDHGAAAGFVKVFGLPIETAARRQGQEGRPANLKKAN
jgi:argininosuccinate synthase